MNHQRLLPSLFLAWLALAYGPGAAADDAATCRQARDRQAGVRTSVLNSYAAIQTSAGTVSGLKNSFCVFTNGSNLGMVDLQTLASRRPSFAATYILKGLNLKEMPKAPPGNPGTFYCQQLQGTSISRLANGGFVSDRQGGQDEVCVFGDGSMVSIWVLIYLSQDPNYLSIRKAIRSQPLALSLPYLGG